MDQQQAVAFVARHIAGLMEAGGFEENTGLNPDRVHPRDASRLDKAIVTVTSRIYNMCGTGEIPDPAPAPLRENEDDE
jgi:hypothetical protein